MALALLGSISLILLIRYIGILRELRSLRQQLEEICCGSQIELGVQGRQRQEN